MIIYKGITNIQPNNILLFRFCWCWRWNQKLIPWVCRKFYKMQTTTQDFLHGKQLFRLGEHSLLSPICITHTQVYRPAPTRHRGCVMECQTDPGTPCCLLRRVCACGERRGNASFCASRLGCRGCSSQPQKQLTRLARISICHPLFRLTLIWEVHTPAGPLWESKLRMWSKSFLKGFMSLHRLCSDVEFLNSNMYFKWRKQNFFNY